MDKCLEGDVRSRERELLQQAVFQSGLWWNI